MKNGSICLFICRGWGASAYSSVADGGGLCAKDCREK